VIQSIHSISGPPSRGETSWQETRVRGAAVVQPGSVSRVEPPTITKIQEHSTPAREYQPVQQQFPGPRDSQDLRTVVVPVQFKPIFIEKEFTPNADLDDEYLECIILNNPQVEEYFKWKNRKGHGTFDEFLESLKQGPLTGENLFKGSRMVSPRSSSVRSIRGLGVRETTESKVSNFADERLRDSISVPIFRGADTRAVAPTFGTAPTTSLSQSVYQPVALSNPTPAFGTRPAQQTFSFGELPAQVMTGTNPAVYTQQVAPVTSQPSNPLASSFRPVASLVSNQVSSSYTGAMPLSQAISNYTPITTIGGQITTTTNNYGSSVRPLVAPSQPSQPSQQFTRTSLPPTQSVPTNNYSVNSYSTANQRVPVTNTYLANNPVTAVPTNAAGALLRQTANFINNQTAPVYRPTVQPQPTYQPSTPVQNNGQYRAINNNYQNDRAQYSGN
jgi:hypothetical protein